MFMGTVGMSTSLHHDVGTLVVSRQNICCRVFLAFKDVNFTVYKHNLERVLFFLLKTSFICFQLVTS